MSDSRLYPSWEQIKSLKQPPTKGELFLLEYLDNNLPKEWEIFFQPYLNGDRPDIAILNKNVGLMIIEVKDWNPDKMVIVRDELKRAMDKLAQVVKV